MTDDPYTDPFISDAPSMSQGDIHLIACLWVGGLVLLTVAVFIRAMTQAALQRGTIARSVARRRLIFTSVFGALAALVAALPIALAAGVDGIGSALICELIGAVVIALFVFCIVAALAQHADHGSDHRETSDDDYRRSRGVNPATGYPMVNSSIDAGGYSYGCGRD